MHCYALDSQLADRLSQIAVEVPETRRLLRRRFPRWIHRGLIEALFQAAMKALRGVFPRWIHRGLIEA